MLYRRDQAPGPNSGIHRKPRADRHGAGRHTADLSIHRAELIAHLDRQFHKGMSWNNYGKRWHVDHIRPVSSFEFSSSNDPSFKECWALINLRPLWKGQNLSKHAKRLHLV
jgi:hypothetical protein